MRADKNIVRGAVASLVTGILVTYSAVASTVTNAWFNEPADPWEGTGWSAVTNSAPAPWSAVASFDEGSKVINVDAEEGDKLVFTPPSPTSGVQVIEARLNFKAAYDSVDALTAVGVTDAKAGAALVKAGDAYKVAYYTGSAWTVGDAEYSLTETDAEVKLRITVTGAELIYELYNSGDWLTLGSVATENQVTTAEFLGSGTIAKFQAEVTNEAAVVIGGQTFKTLEEALDYLNSPEGAEFSGTISIDKDCTSSAGAQFSAGTTITVDSDKNWTIEAPQAGTTQLAPDGNDSVVEEGKTTTVSGGTFKLGGYLFDKAGGGACLKFANGTLQLTENLVIGGKRPALQTRIVPFLQAVIIGYASQPDAAKLLLGAGVTIDSTNGKIELQDDGKVYSVSQVALENFVDAPAGYMIKETYDEGAETYKYFYSLVEIQTVTLSFTYENVTYTVTTNDAQVEVIGDSATVVSNVAFTVEATPVSGYSYKTAPEGWTLTSGNISKSFTASDDPTAVSIPAPAADTPSPDPEAEWFDGKIGAGWPTADGMKGEWCADATTLATLNTEDTPYIEIDTGSDLLKFTPTAKGAVDEGVATITNSIKFSAMDMKSLATVLDGIDTPKGGITLVNNGGAKSFYGLAKDPNGATNMWTKLAALDTVVTEEDYLDVKLELTLKDGVTKIQYTVGGAASGWLEIVLAQNKITAVSYRGYGEVKNLAGAYAQGAALLDGRSIYDTFDNAYLDATNGATIKLLQDAVMGAGLGLKSVKIDANGKTLDISAAKASYNASGYECTYEDGELVVKIPFAGKGTEAEPWQIANTNLLVLMKNGVNAGSYGTNGEYFVQTADLDLVGCGAWNAIGQENGPWFCGTYDGAGYTIDNLTLARARYMALFGGVTDATIKSLTVKVAGVTETGADEYGASAVVGVSKKNLVITDVKAQGVQADTELAATHNVAGIVSQIGGGATFTRCVNELKLCVKYSKGGGICNFITKGTGTYVFDSCTNKADIIVDGTYSGGTKNCGDEGVGGILAYDQGNPPITIKNCQNTGAISVINASESIIKKAKVGSIIGQNYSCNQFSGCVGNSAQADLIAVGTLKDTASGISGLNFATVAGNVATFVADSALAADGSYKVMTPLTTKAVTLAADKSIVFDCSLNTAFEAAITAPAGYHAEVTTNENVKTYTVVADKSVLRFENLTDAHIASVKVEQPVGTELTETAPGVYTLVSNQEYSVTYTAAGGYVFEGGATTKTVVGTAGKAEIVVNPQSGDIPTAGQIFTIAFTPNAFSDYVVTTGEQVEVELTNNKIDFLENTAFTVKSTPKTGFEYATIPEGWQSAAEGAITSNGTVTAAATIVIPLPTEIKVAGWFDGKINSQWPTAAGMNGEWCDNATSLATFDTDHLKLSTKGGSLAFDPTESGNLKENMVTIESEIKFSAMEAADLPYGTEIDDLKSGIALVDNGDTTYNFYGIIRGASETTNKWVDLEISGTPDAYVAVTNVFKYSNKSATVKYIVNGTASSEYGMNASALTVTEVAYRGSGEVKTLTGAKEPAGEAMYGDEPYATFSDAYAAATNNATIKLLKNVAWDGAGAAGYKTIFIDLNGKLLDVSAATTAYAAKGLKCTYKDGKVVVEVPFAGEGTQGAPWQIASYDDIVLFKNGVNAGSYGTNGEYFVQTANIDFAGKAAWEGIGTYKKDKPAESFGFAANYDGGNFKISNLKFTNREYAGLFNQIGNLTADGTVKNLVIENVSFADPTATTSFGGAFLAGHLHRGLIENVTTKGSFGTSEHPLTHNAVGIVCRMNAGSVVSCTNEAAIYCKFSKAAGIVNIVQNESNGGYTGDSVISGCVNSGAISQSDQTGASVGGIAGYVTTPNYVEISGCVNSGVISSTVENANIGQIAGYINADNAITSKVASVVRADTLAIGNHKAAFFNWATVEDDVATLCLLSTNKIFRLMTPMATKEVPLAIESNTWVAIDNQLYPTFSADGKIVAKDTENCKIESATEGTVTTYTCVEIEWATLTVETDAGVKLVTLTNTTYGVEVTAPYKADIDSNVVVSVNYELKPGYSLTNDCVVPTSVTLTNDYLIAITTKVEGVSIASKITTVDNADVKVECISPDGSETNDVTSTKIITYGWTARIVYTAKTGYHFTGDTEFVFTEVKSADGITYTAPEAAINEYKLIYEPGDNATGVWVTNNLVYGEEHTVFEQPEDFVKKGYLFKCWTNEVDGGEAYLPGAVVSNLTTETDVEIYFTAVWTGNVHKISMPAGTAHAPNYVVSNMTDGVKIEMASGHIGGAVYEVLDGTHVTIYYWADEGYVLVGDAVNDLGEVTEDVNVQTVPMALKNCLITVTPAEHTTYVVSNKGAQVYFDANNQTNWLENTVFSVTATADEGYAFASFDGWTKVGESVVTNVLVAKADITITIPNVTTNNYKLIYEAGTGATGKPVTNDCVYGTEFAVAAQPADFSKAGYLFKCWTNEATGATYLPGAMASNLTAVADGEVYFTAVWTGNVHKISMPAGTAHAPNYVVSNMTDNVAVEMASGHIGGVVYEVLDGTHVTIYYWADEGYVLVGDAVKDLGKVTADVSISTVPMALKNCLITITPNENATYVVTNLGKQVYFDANNQTNWLENTLFSVTATPNEGYEFTSFAGWTKVGVSVVTNVMVAKADITIAVPDTQKIQVKFTVPVDNVTVVVTNKTAGGPVLIADQQSYYTAAYGDVILATYTAAAGYSPSQETQERTVKTGSEFEEVKSIANNYTIAYFNGDATEFKAWTNEYTAPTAFAATNVVNIPTAANIDQTSFAFYGWTNAAGKAISGNTQTIYEDLTLFAITTNKYKVTMPESPVGYTYVVSNETTGATVTGEGNVFKVLDGSVVKVYYTASAGYIIDKTSASLGTITADTTVTDLPTATPIYAFTVVTNAHAAAVIKIGGNEVELKDNTTNLVEGTAVAVEATPDAENGYEYQTAEGWTLELGVAKTNFNMAAEAVTLEVPAPTLMRALFTAEIGDHVTVTVTNLTAGGALLETNEVGQYSATWGDSIKASYKADAGWSLVGNKTKTETVTNGFAFAKVTASASDLTIAYKHADGTEFTQWKQGYTPVTEFSVEAIETLPTAENINESTFLFNAWTNENGTVTSTEGYTEGFTVYADITKLWTVTVPTVDTTKLTVTASTNGYPVANNEKVRDGETVKFVFTAVEGYILRGQTEFEVTAKKNGVTVKAEDIPLSLKLVVYTIDATNVTCTVTTNKTLKVPVELVDDKVTLIESDYFVISVVTNEGYQFSGQTTGWGRSGDVLYTNGTVVAENVTVVVPRPTVISVGFTVPVGEHVHVLTVTNLTKGGEALTKGMGGTSYTADYFEEVAATYYADEGWTPEMTAQTNIIRGAYSFTQVNATADVYDINYKHVDGSDFTLWAAGYTAPTNYSDAAHTNLPVAANIDQTNWLFLSWTNAEGTVITKTNGKLGDITVGAKMKHLWSFVRPNIDNATCLLYTNGVNGTKCYLADGDKLIDRCQYTFTYTANPGYVLQGLSDFHGVADEDNITVLENNRPKVRRLSAYTFDYTNAVIAVATNRTGAASAAVVLVDGKAKLIESNEIKITLTPNDGYEFAGVEGWTIEDKSIVSNGTVLATDETLVLPRPTLVDFEINYLTEDGIEFTEWAEGYSATNSFTIEETVMLPTVENVAQTNLLFFAWTNAEGQVVTSTEGITNNLTVAAKMIKLWSVKMPVVENAKVTAYTNNTVTLEADEKVFNGAKVKFVVEALPGYELRGDQSKFTVTATANDVTVEESLLPASLKQYYVTVGDFDNKLMTYVVTNMTIGGATLSPTGAATKVYKVLSNDTVKVAFTAKKGYTIFGAAETNIVDIASDATVTPPLCTATPDYLNFTAVGGEVVIGMMKYFGSGDTRSFEYAFDAEKGPWTLFEVGNGFASNVTVTAGDTVYFRRHALDATNTLSGADNKIVTFTMTTNAPGTTVKAGGNVMSLLDKTCQSLELGAKAFDSLFGNCAVLTDAPALPATTLGDNCYNSMFFNCTSLTNAPALLATNLTDNCYSSMFHTCTSLTGAPELPAKTLVSKCYEKMFCNCANLDTVQIAATNYASGVSDVWLYNVAAQGTFYCPPEFVAAIEGEDRGMSTIPTNWIVNPVTVTVKSVTHATYAFTNLTANGEVKSLGNDKYLVSSNANVEVTYTAEGEYKLYGTNPVIKNNVVADTTITDVPTTEDVRTITYLTEDGIAFTEWAEGYEVTNKFTTSDVVMLPTAENIAQTNLIFFAWTNKNGKVVTSTEGLDANLTVAAKMIKLWSVKKPVVANATCTVTTNGFTLAEDAKVLNGQKVKFVFTAYLGYEFRNATTEFTVTATANDVTVEEGLLPTSLKQYYVTVGEITPADSMTYVVSNLTTGAALSPTGEETQVYKALSNDNVKVAFKAAEGYTIFGAAETNIVEIADDATVTPPLCQATPDYLSFTAVGGDVTIGMKKFDDDVDGRSFEYAFDAEKGPWTLFEVGNGFASNVVVAADQTVYFRRHALDVTNSLVSESFGSYVCPNFTMTTNKFGGTVKAGGNVMSLLDQTCQSLEVGEYAFAWLFNKCDILTDAPALPATTLGNCCYKLMFNGCKSLTEAPLLLAEALVGNCYNNMFSGCSNLDTVRIAATNIAGSSCYFWLDGVAKQGTFYCPAEFVAAIGGVRGGNTIPVGWFVNPVTATVHQVKFTTMAVSNTTQKAEIKDLGNGKYQVSSNATVEVTYTADAGYKFANGETVIVKTVVADTDVDISIDDLPAVKKYFTVTMPNGGEYENIKTTVTTNDLPAVGAEGVYEVFSNDTFKAAFEAHAGYELVGGINTNEFVVTNTAEIAIEDIPVAWKLFDITVSATNAPGHAGLLYTVTNEFREVMTNSAPVAAEDAVYTVRSNSYTRISFNTVKGYKFVGDHDDIVIENITNDVVIGNEYLPITSDTITMTLTNMEDHVQYEVKTGNVKIALHRDNDNNWTCDVVDGAEYKITAIAQNGYLFVGDNTLFTTNVVIASGDVVIGAADLRKLLPVIAKMNYNGLAKVKQTTEWKNVRYYTDMTAANKYGWSVVEFLFSSAEILANPDAKMPSNYIYDFDAGTTLVQTKGDKANLPGTALTGGGLKVKAAFEAGMSYSITGDVTFTGLAIKSGDLGTEVYVTGDFEFENDFMLGDDTKAAGSTLMVEGVMINNGNTIKLAANSKLYAKKLGYNEFIVSAGPDYAIEATGPDADGWYVFQNRNGGSLVYEDDDGVLEIPEGMLDAAFFREVLQTSKDNPNMVISLTFKQDVSAFGRKIPAGTVIYMLDGDMQVLIEGDGEYVIDNGVKETVYEVVSGGEVKLGGEIRGGASDSIYETTYLDLSYDNSVELVGDVTVGVHTNESYLGCAELWLGDNVDFGGNKIRITWFGTVVSMAKIDMANLEAVPSETFELVERYDYYLDAYVYTVRVKGAKDIVGSKSVNILADDLTNAWYIASNCTVVAGDSKVQTYLDENLERKAEFEQLFTYNVAEGSAPGAYTITAEFTAEAAEAIKNAIDAAAAKLANDARTKKTGKVKVATKPGVYYGVAETADASKIDETNPKTWLMGTGSEVQLPFTANKTGMFYQIKTKVQ